MNRLIIVEGLPCSGKSTVSRYIADRCGARFYDEGSGEHPADYEFHAYLTKSEFDGFSANEQALITSKADNTEGGYILPLSGFDGELFEKLLQHKIYDFLPWEIEKPIMLDKWREFLESAKTDERYVFNCVLLQNPMCETMMRFGLDMKASADYIKSICGIISPLEPLVVYLHSENIRKLIEKAAPERGEEWLNGVIDYHCGGAFGRANGLSGFEGYIAALEERQRREEEILKGLGVSYIMTVSPQEDKERAYGDIDRAIKDMI